MRGSSRTLWRRKRRKLKVRVTKKHFPNLPEMAGVQGMLLRFSTEESVLSVSVGGEKLPKMTSQSQIQVSFLIVSKQYNSTIICDWSSENEFEWVILGSALGAPHV